MEKPDIRSYCNTSPWLGEAAQRNRLTGELYVEDKSGTVIDALIRSVRRGTVVEVVEVGLLAPIKGKPAKRRALMVDRVERIKKRGGSIIETETGSDTRKGHLPRMMVRGAEFVATSGRMGGKRGKAGQPAIVTTPHEDEIIGGIWHSRRYGNDDERIAAIQKRTGRKFKRSWLWGKYGSPHKRGGD